MNNNLNGIKAHKTQEWDKLSLEICKGENFLLKQCIFDNKENFDRAYPNFGYEEEKWNPWYTNIAQLIVKSISSSSIAQEPSHNNEQ